jgi:Ca2+-binding EF-hand superfamily protein
MKSQFESLDADGGGSIEKHEVPPAIWKELDTHFNKDGDEEIDRNEYIAAVKKSILDQQLAINPSSGMMGEFLQGLTAQANAKGVEYLSAWSAHLHTVYANSPRSAPQRAPGQGPGSPRAKQAFERCWGSVAVTPSTAHKIRQLFHALDTNQSGGLTANDFTVSGKWDADCKGFFAEMSKFLQDENGDGVIDEGEFFSSFLKVGLETTCPIPPGTALTTAQWGARVQETINGIMIHALYTILYTHTPYTIHHTPCRHNVSHGGRRLQGRPAAYWR